jgi:hypothetical protein
MHGALLRPSPLDYVRHNRCFLLMVSLVATLALGVIVQATASVRWAVPALSMFVLSGSFQQAS